MSITLHTNDWKLMRCTSVSKNVMRIIIEIVSLCCFKLEAHKGAKFNLQIERLNTLLLYVFGCSI